MPLLNGLNQTAFTSPGYDYSTDVNQIERQRALANALQQQSMSPIQTPQTPAGGFTPHISPFEGFSKLAQAYAGNRRQKKADEQERALSGRVQSDYQSMLAKGIGQLQGTPATQTSEDAAGNVTPAQAATGPNPMAALQTFGSHPMGQQFVPLAMQEMQRQRLAEALRGGQGAPQTPQPSPMNPAGPNPSVMAGSGPVPMQQGPQPAGMKTGGPAGGLPMEVWLQADPSGKLYMEQIAKDYAESNKPVVNRGYGIGRMVGGQYVPDPASSEQALALERGKAGIGATYGVHNVQQAGGGLIPTFGYQLPGFGGLPGMQGGQGAPQSAPQPVPGQPPAPQAPKAAPTTPAPQPVQAPRPSIPQPAPQAAPQPVGDPWASMPKMQHPQGIGETTYYRETATRAAEQAHKLAEKYGAVAQTANERKSFNDQSLDMLPRATTGPGALSITGVQNFLNSRFGIPLDQLAKASAGDAAATQELNKNLLNAATKTAKANYGSRMTQSEVMMQIKQGSPNVDMTRAAIAYLLKADNARADYEIKQASDAGRYIQQGGDPYQFEGWYAKNFPMSGAVRGSQNVVKDIVNSGSSNDPLGIRANNH